jgi:hypothetical protein
MIIVMKSLWLPNVPLKCMAAYPDIPFDPPYPNQ